MKALAIIPARYGSTRFPGKPLAQINGKPMIQRVYQQCVESKVFTQVVVATDDDRIATAVKSFGGEVVLTSPNHPSGTDRCAEALTKIKTDANIVVNVQGDEPFVTAEHFNAVLKSFEDKNAEISTLCVALKTAEDVQNPNKVKLVKGANGKALYFSRSVVPFCRDNTIEQNIKNGFTYYKHIGLYAFKTEILPKLTQLKPSTLELAESLEQLRWLENNYSIYVQQVKNEPLGIDTPEDLEKALKSF